MRLKAITPIHVGADELARRQRRFDGFAGDQVSVALVDLPRTDDVPRQLASAEDIAASDRLVAAEARTTDPAEFDAVLPDCVLDPAVDAIRLGGGPVPIHGITELAGGYLAALGRPFAAVTRNQAIGDELVARIARYGLTDMLAGLHVLDLSFADITDEARWNAALTDLAPRLVGAGAVLNGCSAVDVMRTSGPPVVDPTRLALRLLDLAAADGMV